MATIPTYESQQIQVTPKQEFFVPSTVSAIVEGINRGIQQAGDVVDAVDKYNQAKAKEAYDLNEAPRYEATTNSLVGLNDANNKIRAGMASAPNPYKANELLEQEYNKILNNPPQGLDDLSQQEWQKYVMAEKRRLMLANLNWGNKAAATAGKKAAQNANRAVYDMYMNDAWWAGITSTPYDNAGLSLDKQGRYTERHMPALDPSDTDMQNALHRSNLLGAAAKPLSNREMDGNSVGGILGEIDTLEGVGRDNWWSRNLWGGEKGKTKQEIGQEKIQDYFDGVRESIEASGLGSSEKKALTAYADAQQRTREREFTAYIEASNLEKQSLLGRMENPMDVKDWLRDYRVQQEKEDKKTQGRMELNPIRENETVDELRTDDYLANLTFGRTGDNAYYSVATRFSTLPLGRVDNFSEPLKIAVDTLSMPIGEWDKAELVKKYAPGGTINENQVLETLMQNSPTLKLKGEEIDAMKAENGFDEFGWAIDTISEIASMPENTNEEKQRKQAAVNHTLYQAQKEVNGGMGFSNPELSVLFNDALVGQQNNQDGSVSYNPLVGNETVIREMAKMGLLVGNFKDNKYLHKEAVSVIGRGLIGANAEYRQTEDINTYKNRIRKINQDVLATQYRGVLDIDELQSKVDNKQQALFMYNGRPYEYLGFSGKDIFIKAGNQKQKLGD